MTTKLRYGSLFSGVGGFDLGFDQENYECVFQVEWDKHCQKILAKHWPTVPKWSDVQDVNGAEIPPCDVLTFGSPCQDLSVAGKRAGLEGTKSSMFYEATRIIQEMRNATESVYPRIVVWENVPGALSSNNGADFGAVIDTLANIGAVDIQWSVLDAQFFGVPQRRRRIFLVAQFDPATVARCPDPLLPVVESSRGDFAKGRKARKSSARTIETSTHTNDQSSDHRDNTETLTITPDEQRMPDENELQPVDVPIAYSIREDAKANNFSATETDTALCLNGMVPSTQSHHAQLFIAESIIFENSFRDGPRIGDDICHTLPAKMGSGGGNTPMLAQPTIFIDRAAFNQGENAKYEAVISDDPIISSLVARGPHAVLTNLAVRRLTPLECERLMGWPDDHTRFYADGTEQADTNRYRQCGNGVATPVARFIAKHLKNILITNDNE